MTHSLSKVQQLYKIMIEENNSMWQITRHFLSSLCKKHNDIEFDEFINHHNIQVLAQSEYGLEFAEILVSYADKSEVFFPDHIYKPKFESRFEMLDIDLSKVKNIISLLEPYKYNHCGIPLFLYEKPQNIKSNESLYGIFKSLIETQQLTKEEIIEKMVDKDVYKNGCTFMINRGLLIKVCNDKIQDQKNKRCMYECFMGLHNELISLLKKICAIDKYYMLGKLTNDDDTKKGKVFGIIKHYENFARDNLATQRMSHPAYNKMNINESKKLCQEIFADYFPDKIFNYEK